MQCTFCKKENDVAIPVGRRESCLHCGQDLHICLNCLHYDRSSYNECRENSADRVVDKDRSNFCDYFSPQKNTVTGEKLSESQLAKMKLAELFKK